MTVPNASNKSGPFLTNGVTTQFAFDKRLLQAADLKVYRTDILTAQEELLTSGYSVSLINGGADGATVTITPPLVTGYKITLVREVNYLQDDYDPSPSSTYYAEVLEGAMDKRVMQIQQLKEQVDRAIKIPITADGVSPDLPAPVANSVIGSTDGLTYDNLTLVDAGQAIAGNWTVNRFVDGVGFTAGVSTSVTLTKAPASAASILVLFDGVPQQAHTYSVASTTVNFTSAIPLGVSSVEVRIPTTLAVGAPGDGAVLDTCVATASGGNTARTLAARFADVINVKDFGAVGDASTDDTTAIAAAISAASAAGGGTVNLLGKFRITSTITVPTKVKLLGAGSLTSSAASRSPSTIIKDFNGLGVLFDGDDSGTEGVHYDQTSGKTGDLVQVYGSRWNAPSIAVTNAGQDGLRIGKTDAGAATINANLWSIGFLAAYNNARYGINIDDTNTTTSGNYPLGAPNCNAGCLVRADLHANGSDGMRLGNTIDNFFGSVVAQSNTGRAVRFDPYARNNFIQKLYSEANTAGDGIIDANARHNVVWASRAVTLGITSYWTNNGGDNNLLMAHGDGAGSGTFDNVPWHWGGEFSQASTPYAAIMRHRQYVGASYVYGELRTETDGVDGTKVIINTRKTGVGQRDVLATDEDGKIYVKTAGTAGAGGLVIGPDKANYSQVLSGFGTPEGAITAERGSLYLRMDGGAGTCLYVKQTGSGNTGWVGK